MNDPKIKQKIANQIKDSANILVTVSKNPSVDELSAALGLTLLLNKMDKHATAVFSGKIPPAITFLDPEKTFEDTTDSLRDFIIALDKDKADHLRYKLEGDLVKIYITPYRSIITEDDLEFSQGDYNVELVLALGVESKDNLDHALAAHGQILDDATVITLTSGQKTSNLGKIDWHDSNASSLSEMLTSLFENLGVEKKLLDRAIATAWLTGIVAATERFSNERTSSRAMNLAAQLMSAGADQQLIVTKLEENKDDNSDNDELVDEVENDAQSGKDYKSKDESNSAASKTRSDDGALVIDRSNKATLEEVGRKVSSKRLSESKEEAERALGQHSSSSMGSEESVDGSFETIDQLEARIGKKSKLSDDGASDYEISGIKTSKKPGDSSGPTFGGQLNATTSQAEEQKRQEEARNTNRVILSRSNYVKDDEQVVSRPPINSAQESTEDENLSYNEPVKTGKGVYIETPSSLDSPKASEDMTLADIDAQHRATPPDVNNYQSASEAALEQATSISGLPLPPPPPVPSLDVASGLPPLPPLPQADLPENSRLGDILDGAQVVPPTPTEQPSTDPGQFKIPGH